MLVTTRLSIRIRTAMHSPATCSTMPCSCSAFIAPPLHLIVYANKWLSRGQPRSSRSDHSPGNGAVTLRPLAVAILASVRNPAGDPTDARSDMGSFHLGEQGAGAAAVTVL